MRKKQTRKITLQLYTLRFEPKNEYKANETTRTIINQVFEYLREQRKQGNGHLIDRHENQDKVEPRELFMTAHRQLPKDRQIRCSMALLRKGKQPKLKPTDTFKLLPLSTIDGDIAEETHFFIDFSGSECIVLAEYNYNGPRASDLEYYLRNVAGPNTLKIVKTTELTALYSTSLEETLENLHNVLKIDVKMKPSNLDRMDADVRQSYYSSMENIGKDLKPQFLRIQTYFQIPGSNTPVGVNIEATKWFREMLNVFRTRKRNIKLFERFEVKYQDKHGDEPIFSLLKGREEIVVEVEQNMDIKNKELYAIMKPAFDQFLVEYYND
tara:strand:+ start:188430 stop:189404 length:975 start_codon:yes stop_codon:yes gene_type:complete